MKYRLCLFFVVMLIVGCSNNKKAENNSADTISIHKLWKYDTVRSASTNPGLIGKHLLDLTNKDTLHFSYRSIKDNSTAYGYSILHDTIFVNKNAAYKIIKLTTDELDLYILFKKDNIKASKDSVIMVYKTK